jgi:hypothetical protein
MTCLKGNSGNTQIRKEKFIHWLFVWRRHKCSFLLMHAENFLEWAEKLCQGLATSALYTLPMCSLVQVWRTVNLAHEFLNFVSQGVYIYKFTTVATLGCNAQCPCLQRVNQFLLFLSENWKPVIPLDSHDPKDGHDPASDYDLGVGGDPAGEGGWRLPVWSALPRPPLLSGLSQRYSHRVDRVLGFFSNRSNRPNPSPGGEWVLSPLWFRGEGYTRWGERGWREGSQSDEGTYTVVL